MDLDLDAIEARAKALLNPALCAYPECGGECAECNGKLDGPGITLALVARAREADRLDGVDRDNTNLTWAVRRAEERAEAAEGESARLRAVVEKLRAGLKPFGAVADHDVSSEETDADIYRPLTYNRAEKISIGHLRAAARLLAETAPEMPADQDGRAG